MLTRTILAALALGATLGAQTYVVDDDGGPTADFTDIQPAVDAALPGDVILVRDGSYGAVLVERGVRIVADPDGLADMDFDALEVRDVPADETAVIAGLAPRAVFVHDCAGEVVLDALITDTSGFVATVRIHDCSRVTVSRAEFNGASGTVSNPGFPSYSAKRAVEVLRSTVILSGVVLRGGTGGANYKSDGRDGAPALQARDAVLFVQTSTLRGGRGGDAWEPFSFEFEGDGGDGAPALHVERCDVEISGRPDDELRGGRGGDPGFVSLPGAPGPAVEAIDSTLTWSGVTFDVEAPAPVFEATGSSVSELAPAVPALALDGAGTLGDAASWTLLGEPGASAQLYVSAASTVASVGSKSTKLLIDPLAAVSIATVPLDASGAADVPFAVPNDVALLGLAVHVQAIVVPPSGPTRLSSSIVWVLR